MKLTGVFAAGMLAAVLLLLPALAQDTGVRGLNHVGLVVQNYEEAKDFYTKKLGFREAYTIRRPDGSVQLTYLQLNRETFVELIPAGPNQQPGITHFGIEVGNLDAMVSALRAKGVTASAPGLTPANARSSRIQDADGFQIEVMEFGSEALQRKAMESWK